MCKIAIVATMRCGSKDQKWVNSEVQGRKEDSGQNNDHVRPLDSKMNILPRTFPPV